MLRYSNNGVSNRGIYQEQPTDTRSDLPGEQASPKENYITDYPVPSHAGMKCADARGPAGKGCQPPSRSGLPVKTIEIRVSGKVQKVGFRNCVKRIASRLNVKGEVMNLSDGTVRVLASGDEIVLEKFLSMIYGCPRAIIRDIEVNEIAFSGFPDFSIRRPA